MPSLPALLRLACALCTLCIAAAAAWADAIGAEAPAEVRRVVRVGAFKYYPGIFQDEKGVVRGHFVDLLEAVAKDEGWRLEFVYGDWDEGLARVRSGEVDVLTSVAYTEERTHYLDYCDRPLLTVWGELYVRPRSNIAGVLDADQQRIAVMRGDYNARAFRSLADSFGLSCSYVEVGDFDRVMALVRDGAADAGVVNSLYGTTRHPYFGLESTGIVFNAFRIYFAVGKGRSSDVLSALNRHMDAWAADPDSLQRLSRERWIRGAAAAHPLPRYLKALLLGMVVLLAAAAVFLIVLRRQVARATRKLSAQARRLQTSEERYRMLVENQTDLLVKVDQEGRLLFVSPSYCELFGRKESELLGQPFMPLVHEEDQASTARAMRELQHPPHTCYLEQRANTARGWRWLAWSDKAILGPDDRIRVIIGVGRDITALKEAQQAHLELERRLLHSQKLESLGVLAGGIAHDFNNLLAAVIGNLDLARIEAAAHPSLGRSIEQALEGARRGADLTRQILAYSGRGRFAVSAVRLDEVAAENVRIFRTAIARNIQLSVTSVAGTPLIEADPGQVQQVIMNLLTNASEAIGDRPGTVQLAIGASSYGREELSASLLEDKPAPGRFAWVEVQDDGCGMDAETLRRIFDPFFTTKFTGRGLGMSVVQGIVRSHGGAILVSSVPGQGTTVRVLFPVRPISAATTGPGAGSRTPFPSPPVSGTVLVVDDEEMVRRLCARMLERLGCRALTAGDGEDALRLAREHEGAIALAVVDLTMPRRDGVATLEEIRRLRPAMRVVLSSGFSEQESRSKLGGQSIDGFLAKPFTYDAFTAEIRRQLASAPAAGNGA